MSAHADRPNARSPAANASGWEATRVQTQIARVAGEGRPGAHDIGQDIGRDVGNNLRELFVACDPADAIQQQFDHLNLNHVAVHDLGIAASRKLLEGIAAGAARAVQRLVIRRPGGGTTLATIDFVDCPATNGSMVRLYSTAVDADTVTRQAVGRVLLSNARLGVLLIGDLPPHALASALLPLSEAVQRGGWNCRRLLMMPLANAAALPAEVLKFRAGTGIDASPTPQVTRPTDVWTLLCGAWNSLQLKAAPHGTASAALPLLGAASGPQSGSSRATAASAADAGAAAQAPTPMPVVGAAAPSRDAPLERYLHDLSHLSGVVSACAFDVVSGQPVGHAGARPGPQELARQGSTLLAATVGASRALGLGGALPEMALTLGQHHLLVRPLPGHPGHALHAVLDKSTATLALVLVQLRRLDDELAAATRATTGR